MSYQSFYNNTYIYEEFYNNRINNSLLMHCQLFYTS